MKLSIAIAILFGVNSLVAATTIKGRTLKGSGRQLKKKKSKGPCPKRTAYKAPASCNAYCYSDMTTLSNDINLALLRPPGPTFTGTICSGTYVWPAAASVSGALANAKLELSCCGSENSCVITGETPSVTRSTPLLAFTNPVHLILQGLSFANIDSTAAGTLVYTDTPAVVEVKNVMVDSLTSSSQGGVFLFKRTDATINDSIFTNNKSVGDGGVIYANKTIIQMNGNAFAKNVAANNAGALHIFDSTLLATCNTFENNSAIGYGGAISGTYPHLQLTNNQFLGNQAAEGGAVSMRFQAIVSIGNTYSMNVATVQGGALFIKTGAGELVDDTFTLNSAPLNNGSDVYVLDSALNYCNCPTLTPVTLNAVDSIALAQCF